MTVQFHRPMININVQSRRRQHVLILPNINVREPK